MNRETAPQPTRGQAYPTAFTTRHFPVLCTREQDSEILTDAAGPPQLNHLGTVGAVQKLVSCWDVLAKLRFTACPVSSAAWPRHSASLARCQSGVGKFLNLTQPQCVSPPVRGGRLYYHD